MQRPQKRRPRHVGSVQRQQAFDNRSQPRIDRRCRGNQRDVSELLRGGDERMLRPHSTHRKTGAVDLRQGQRRKQGQQALPLRRKIISCRLGGGFAASAAEWIDQKDASPQQPSQPLKLPPIGQKTWQKQNWRRIGAVVGHRRELKKKPGNLARDGFFSFQQSNLRYAVTWPAQARLMVMRRLIVGLGLCGLLALGGATGCGPRAIVSDLTHHNMSDEDLLQLLPQGQEAVFDIELQSLRAWPPARSLMALLPEGAQRRLRDVAADPLSDLDAVCIGLRGLGTKDVEATLLFRGSPSRNKLWQQMLSRPQSREVTYHGMPIAEVADESLAQLTPQTVVLGSRLQVRQTIDIFRGVDHGARKQQALVAALAMAPTGKAGRPAVLMAILPSSDLRQKAHNAGLLRILDDAQAVAVAMAIGDGFDIGIVASYPDVTMAQSALAFVNAQAAELSLRPLTKALGLERFISPLVAVAVPQSKKRPTPELHLAYRLPGDDLAELLRRIEQLKQLFPSQRN